VAVLVFTSASSAQPSTSSAAPTPDAPLELARLLEPAPVPVSQAVQAQQPPLTPRQQFELELAALGNFSFDDSGADTLPVQAAITLNGVSKPSALVLRHRDGRWLIPEELVSHWLMRPSTQAALEFEGALFFDAGAWPGYSAQFDPVQSQLNLQFAAEAFTGEGLRILRADRPKPLATGYGGYMNYDFLATGAQAVNGEKGSDSTVNGLLELVGYAPIGRVEASAVLNSIGEPLQGGKRFERLETTFFHDFLDFRSTLALGDYTGVSGLWGRPRRAGGIQFGTNFGTQPGFVTSPLLNFDGQSTTPAVLDLVIEGQRRRVGDVASGPFSVRDIPVINGAGEAQLIVTDVLGRQQIIRQSFITATELLRQGLTEFSLEVGKLRSGLGDRYDDWQAVAQVQRGLSNSLTGEVRVERAAGITAVGLGSIYGHPYLGVVQAFAVESRSSPGNGSLAGLSYRLPTNLGINFNASAKWATQEFRDTADAASGGDPARPEQEFAGSVGFRLPLSLYGSVGYVEQRFRPDDGQSPNGNNGVGSGGRDVDRNGHRQLTTISASKSQGAWSLYFQAQQVEGAARTRSGSINLGYRFKLRGPELRYSSSRNQGESGGSSEQRFTVAKDNSAEAEGVSWRSNVIHRRNDGGSETGSIDALGSWRRPSSEVEAGLAYHDDRLDWRAGLRGAMGVASGVPFIARRVTRSLAILNEPALAGLPLLVNGQRISTFSPSGRAVLPNLTPYADNKVTVDLSEADWNLDASRTEVLVIPGNRTGHVVSMGGRRLFSALVQLRLSDGTPVPTGTIVSLEGGPEKFVVADQGEVYVISPSAMTSLRLRLNGRTCVIALDIPSGKDGDVQLGPYTCKTAPLSSP
jgi:outer membrane usher protein